MERKHVNPPDIREKGAPRDGKPQTSDHRLFMQLLAFGDCGDSRPLADALALAGVQGALYEDINDPYGTAVVTFSDDPEFFVTQFRDLLHDKTFATLRPKPQFTMFGRTYAIGYEPDLEETLIGRPRRSVLNPQWPWAIWYPLRRSGAFAQLSAEQQRGILGEHGSIGMAFGQADYAHDVRLACHGLDEHDNDFVIGLTGKQLYPLSAVVQAMRKTKQTSQYLDSLGPFLVGKAVWQSQL